MALRIASIVSILAFVACLLAGVLVGDNRLETTVLRALAAMAGMFAVGLVVGLMSQAMVRERLAADAEILKEARRQHAEALASQKKQQEEILDVG
jgi:hypothetical protein